MNTPAVMANIHSRVDSLGLALVMITKPTKEETEDKVTSIRMVQ